MCRPDGLRWCTGTGQSAHLMFACHKIRLLYDNAHIQLWEVCEFQSPHNHGGHAQQWAELFYFNFTSGVLCLLVFSGSSSRWLGLVFSVWLWCVLIIHTYFFALNHHNNSSANSWCFLFLRTINDCSVKAATFFHANPCKKFRAHLMNIKYYHVHTACVWTWIFVHFQRLQTATYIPVNHTFWWRWRIL